MEVTITVKDGASRDEFLLACGQYYDALNPEHARCIEIDDRFYGFFEGFKVMTGISISENKDFYNKLRYFVYSLLGCTKNSLIAKSDKEFEDFFQKAGDLFCKLTVFYGYLIDYGGRMGIYGDLDRDILKICERNFGKTSKAEQAAKIVSDMVMMQNSDYTDIGFVRNVTEKFCNIFLEKENNLNDTY